MTIDNLIDKLIAYQGGVHPTIAYLLGRLDAAEEDLNIVRSRVLHGEKEKTYKELLNEKFMDKEVI